MSASDQISDRYPDLGRRLGRLPLASLPTPVTNACIELSGTRFDLSIKNDGVSGSIYGGNKVRKLEYALWPALAKKKRRVATFGAIGSNHALATALYATQLGLETTCFLVHQLPTASTGDTLRRHLANNTRIIRYGGAYSKRIGILRQHLGDRQSWVIPAGGSSWPGCVGFVNAGLELAAQIDIGEIEEPDDIYIATGTMGSAAGLAIGLALAGLRSQVQAIRVSMTHIANDERLAHLIGKVIQMLQRLGPEVPGSLQQRVSVKMRHEFFAGGYAHTDDATDNAIRVARDQLGLDLEATYSGKAMAALLCDRAARRGGRSLFWNTYNASRLPPVDDAIEIADNLPQEFRRYLD